MSHACATLQYTMQQKLSNQTGYYVDHDFCTIFRVLLLKNGTVLLAKISTLIGLSYKVKVTVTFGFALVPTYLDF